MADDDIIIENLDEEEDDDEEEEQPEDNGDQGEEPSDGGDGGGDPDPEIAELYDYIKNSGETSRGERFDDQDDDTKNLFSSTHGESAASRWAAERENTYYPDQEQQAMPRARTATMEQPDFSQQRRESFDVNQQIERQQTPSFSQQRQQAFPEQWSPQPMPTVPQALADVPYRPPSTPPVNADSSEGTRVQQAGADRAAAEAAIMAKAAGATDEQAIVTSTRAATAAALALDKRSMLGESPETQSRFRATYGENAASEWAKQHDVELERNQVIYGMQEPEAGRMPLNPAMQAPPAPDRRIGAPVSAATGTSAGAPSVVTPGSAVAAGATAPAVPGAAPVAGTPAAKPTVPGATPTAPAAPVNPALAADHQDVTAFGSDLGRLVNADDPILAVASLNEEWVKNGQVDPEFAKNVALAVARDAVDSNTYLDPIAQMAWYRDRVGRGESPEAPEMADPEYVTAWKGMWRAGETAPLTTALKESLHSYGFKSPAEWRARAPVASGRVGPDESGAVSTGRVGPSATGARETIEGEAAGNVLPTMRLSDAPAPAASFGPPPAVAQSGTTPSTMVAGTYERSPNLSMNLSPEQIDQEQQGTRPQIGPQPWELRAPPASEQARDRSYLESLPLLTQAFRSADTPLDAVTRVQLATERGSASILEPGDDKMASTHLAAALSSGAEWAAPALENIARLAYAKETRSDPSNAPQDYINSWIGAWKGGDQSVPLVKELDAQLYDAGIRMVPGTKQLVVQNGPITMVNTPFGEDLSYNQQDFARVAGVMSGDTANNACGPAALLSFQRAAGRNPTPLEAKQLGAAVGWQGGAFPGAANMVKALRSQGVDVNDVQRADFPSINAEIDAGKPVIFDTSKGSEGHYFVVYGRNTQNGTYLVGGSGEALRGGSKWMTPTAMSVMGTPQNMITMRGGRDGNFVRRIAEPEGDRPTAAPVAPVGGTTQAAYAPGGAPSSASAAVIDDAPNEPMVRAFQRELTSAAPQLPGKMDTSGGRDEVLRQWAPLLNYTEAKTGIPAEYMAGIIIAESNGGQSRLAKENNNWFSVTSSDLDTMKNGTVKYADNPLTFSSYATPNASLARFVGMISHPENRNYNQAWRSRRNIDGFIQGLHQGGYATKADMAGGWGEHIKQGADTYKKLGLKGR